MDSGAGQETQQTQRRPLGLRIARAAFSLFCLSTLVLVFGFVCYASYGLYLAFAPGDHPGRPDGEGSIYLALGTALEIFFGVAVWIVYRAGLRLLDLAVRSKGSILPATTDETANPARFPGRYGKIYRLLATLLAATGCWAYVGYPFAGAYTSSMEAHRVLGTVAYLMLPAFLYLSSRQFNGRGLSAVVAVYPLFCVFSVLTANPLILTFLINVIFMPLFILTMSVRNKPAERVLAIATWCAFACLLSVVVSTGLFSVMDPNRLRFSSAYRTYHWLLVFWFLPFTAWLVYGRWKHKRLVPKSLRALLVPLGVTALAAFPLRTVTNMARAHLSSSGMADRTFATKALTQGDKKPFRTMNPLLMQQSSDCKECHPLANGQWLHSTHAYAARNKSFQKVVRTMAAQHGAEFIRLCATCHDPGVALASDPGLLINETYLARSDGVGCRACHYMTSGDVKNGRYSLSIPRSDWLYGDAAQRNRYVRNAVMEHVSTVSGPLVKSGAVCYPCHSLESTRKGATLHPIDNVSSYLRSAYPSSVPCFGCHMVRTAKDDHSYSWQDHAFLGVNESLDITAMTADPSAPAGIATFTKRTVEWLFGRLERIPINETIFDETVKSYKLFNYATSVRKLTEIERVAAAPSPFVLELSAEHVQADGPQRSVALDFAVTNDTIGHDFPSSLFANIEDVRLQLIVTDALGHTVLAPPSPEASHTLGRLEVDAAGTPIQPEDSLKYVAIVNNVFLEPKIKHPFRYVVPLPEGLSYPLKARLEVAYRRYNDRHVNWFSDGKVQAVPERILGSRTFELASRQPGR